MQRLFPLATASSLSVALAAQLAASCGQGGAGDAAHSPPFNPVGTVEDVMHDIVYPHAEVVWDSVGTIVTAEGAEEIQPGSEEEWLHVTQSAYTIAEAANLLMMDGRAKDSGDWMDYAHGLIGAAQIAMEAAQRRDPQALFNAGGDVYAACTACHETYWEKPPSAMRP